jgi:hypothetical protein
VCRYQLPGWQAFYEQHRHEDFELLSVAVDMQGATAARPWHAVAQAAFTTVVDSENVLARLHDAKVIPNGLFIAPDGSIRMKVIGGFDVAKPEYPGAVRQLIRGEAATIALTGSAKEAPRLGPTKQELVATKLRLGEALLALGQPEAAVAEWRWALFYDPDNFTIRKQIWVLEHPEKFVPTIDFDWQKATLARERETEAEWRAAGCGPDGCPLPEGREERPGSAGATGISADE